MRFWLKLNSKSEARNTKFTRLGWARIINLYFPMFETGNKMVVIKIWCEKESFGHWNFDHL